MNHPEIQTSTKTENKRMALKKATARYTCNYTKDRPYDTARKKS